MFSQLKPLLGASSTAGSTCGAVNQPNAGFKAGVNLLAPFTVSTIQLNACGVSSSTAALGRRPGAVATQTLGRPEGVLFGTSHADPSQGGLITIKFEPTDLAVKCEPLEIEVKTEPLEVPIKSEELEANVKAEPVDTKFKAEPVDVKIKAEAADVKPKVEELDIKPKVEELDVKMKAESTEATPLSEPLETTIRSEAGVSSTGFPLMAGISRMNGYRCRYCNKALQGPSRLVIHERTHTGDKPFQCNVCSKAYCSRASLTRHHRSHAEEYPFQCSECSKGYPNRRALNKHKKTHIKVTPYNSEDEKWYVRQRYRCFFPRCRYREYGSSRFQDHLMTHPEFFGGNSDVDEDGYDFGFF